MIAWYVLSFLAGVPLGVVAALLCLKWQLRNMHMVSCEKFQDLLWDLSVSHCKKPNCDCWQRIDARERRIMEQRGTQ